MKNFFGIEDKRFTKKEIVLYIAIAYIFSVAIRFYWIYWASGFDSFYWNNQIMINNNDGYFFASGVQKALYGMHQFNPLVPEFWDRGLVFVTTILTKILPFSLETILLYMSGFLASLIVIPIVLLGRLYNLTFVGFLASLLASIAWSYYNRTMFGYYDTDMFSVMVITFIFYFLIASIEKRSFKSLFIASLISAVYPFLYAPGKNVLYGLVILYTIYLFIYFKKEDFFYRYIILLYLSLLPIYFLVKIPVIMVFYIFLERDKFSKKSEKYIAIFMIALFLFWSKALFQIWGKISVYFFKEGVEERGLHFYKVMQTIREASGIPFETLANRISGHMALFFLSLLGYIFLVIKKRSFVLSLIFVGLGLFAYKGGLRFTIYAVPFLAFSLIYLFWLFTIWIEKRYIKYIAISIFSIAALLPNIKHIIDYKVPVVFNKSEVEALDILRKKSTPKDFVLTWWDYGYPIWFYAEKSTLIDGGKHNHDNFLVSEILSTDSFLEAARLARISVETYVKQIEWYKKYKEGLDISNIPEKFIFENNKTKIVATPGTAVADAIFQNGKKEQVDPNSFLEELKYGDVKLPKKSRDIYIYLPLRLMEIFPTVKEFSNIDLTTGKRKKDPFFYYSEFFKDTKDFTYLGNGVAIDKKRGLIKVGKGYTPIKNFYQIAYTQSGKMIKNVEKLRSNAILSVIYLQSYRAFIVLDDEMLNSLYVKMFVFDEYDRELFEPVVITPFSKIYRVKI